MKCIEILIGGAMDNSDLKAIHELCLKLLEAGAPGKALEHAQIAMRVDPDDDISLFCLARSRMALGQFESAVEALEDAVRINPEFSQHWSSLARCYHKIERHEDALACYGKANRLSPCANFYISSARVRLELGDYEGGLADLDMAQKFELRECDEVLIQGYKAHLENVLEIK